MSLAAELFPGLASHVWSSTVFLLAVLTVLFFMRRRLTASARCSLALVGLAKFALPDVLLAAWARRLAGGAGEAIEVPLQLVRGMLRIDPAPAQVLLWPAIALGVWSIVAFVLLLRLILAHHRLRALRASSAQPPRWREVAALERARRRVGVRGAIEIVRSTMPEAPAVLGVLRPQVVLPATGCDSLSDDELMSLLCHECAHVARRDNLVAVGASILCALFWFHPLVWVTWRILRNERECACDEIAADSADGGDAYLAALLKFCHAAICPPSPGISRMATTQLKERMDYVMHYPTLKAQAPSPWRVALLAVAALALFTVASGIAGVSKPARAGSPYAIRITATRTAGSIAVVGAVRENATKRVVASPALTLDASRRGSARSSAPGGLQVVLEARPDGGDRVAVEVAIQKGGELLQKNTLLVAPSNAAAAKNAQDYTGEPIDLNVANADLREVIATFGSITGLELRIDEAVQGQVSVSWQNVPWDEALDSILQENGLTYRIEGSTLHVAKR